MAKYTAVQRKAVISRAIAAVNARVEGRSTFTMGGQTFELDKGGWCNRFIRQVFETALGMEAFTWRFGALKAYLTLKKLEAYRIPLRSRRPGDILGIEGNPLFGFCGHIMLYLGREFDPHKELVAENTSATRGYPRKPGTKVTSYATVRARITGCYRLFEE